VIGDDVLPSLRNARASPEQRQEEPPPRDEAKRTRLPSTGSVWLALRKHSRKKLDVRKSRSPRAERNVR